MMGRCGLCITVTLVIATVAWWLAYLVLPSADETHIKQNAGTSSDDVIRSNKIPEGNKQSNITSVKQRGWGRTEPCPPCPSMFGKLEQTRWGEGGTTQQYVKLQVRGQGDSKGVRGAQPMLGPVCRD